jgi:hypothetical protein
MSRHGDSWYGPRQFLGHPGGADCRGSVTGADVKREYDISFLRRSPERLPHRMPDRLRAVEPVKECSPQTQTSLSYSPGLLDCSFHGVRRDIRYADQTFRIVRAELRNKVVVGPVRR